jgi:hypothetical protein
MASRCCSPVEFRSPKLRLNKKTVAPLDFSLLRTQGQSASTVLLTPSLSCGTHMPVHLNDIITQQFSYISSPPGMVTAFRAGWHKKFGLIVSRDTNLFSKSFRHALVPVHPLIKYKLFHYTELVDNCVSVTSRRPLSVGGCLETIFPDVHIAYRLDISVPGSNCSAQW